MSIRVLLSDDEALARGRLRSLLQDEPDLEIVAECGDGKLRHRAHPAREARPGLSRRPDARSRRLRSGRGAAEAGHLPLTIFVTAYDRYAMRAFEVHALDYLLKPVNKERLGEALDHARKQLLHPSEAMFQKRVLEMLGDLDTASTRPSASW